MSSEWILLRGLMSEPYHWWDFLPLLRERLSGATIHTPNIHGCGETGHLPTPTTISENLRMLRAQVGVADAAPAKRIVFGFSLGGMLALEWAYAHPEEVGAIVLVNCSLANSAPHRRFTPHAVKNVLRALVSRDPIRREELMLSLTAGLEGERLKTIAKVWHARGSEYPVRPLNFFAQIRLASRMRQRPEPPPVPILILSSGRDRVLHPDCSRRLAETWGLPVVVHPDAGHDLTLNDPHWVIEQLARWEHSGFANATNARSARATHPRAEPSPERTLPSAAP